LKNKIKFVFVNVETDPRLWCTYSNIYTLLKKETVVPCSLAKKDGVFFFFFFFVYRGASLLVVEACLSLFEQLAERGAIDFRRPFKRDCTIILFLHHF
jgi:hypothetical protein